MRALDDITGAIVDASFRIHSDLGLACWNPFTRLS
jgi:hypothetical protein